MTDGNWFVFIAGASFGVVATIVGIVVFASTAIVWIATRGKRQYDAQKAAATMRTAAERFSAKPPTPAA